MWLWNSLQSKNARIFFNSYYKQNDTDIREILAP